MIGIVGYSGFVGRNLSEQLSDDYIGFNSNNINEITNYSFEELYISAVQAKKWWANQNPNDDKKLIDELLSQLSNVKANRVIMISTVDVYDPPLNADEETPISESIHPYGANRFYAEQKVKALFDKVHIIRLQGLVANNLSKNIVYDLKHKNMLDVIDPDSSLQWYPLSRLNDDINIVLEHDIPLINLSVKPIQTNQIVELANLSPEELTQISKKEGASVRYDVTSRYSHLWGNTGGYIVSAEQALDTIKEYFSS